MPGLIVAVRVSPGQEVKKGEALVILESMKMENELKAPRDGKIGAVRVEARQAVDQGQTLVTIE
jgi:biotin carboxyl carrier protein